MHLSSSTTDVSLHSTEAHTTATQKVDLMDSSKPIGNTSHNESLPEPVMKTSAKGVKLVPQPSDDPRDPLNWPSTKKGLTLAVICLAAFASSLQALTNGSGLVPEAELYRKSTLQISYSLSAANAGLAVGPLIWSPVSRRFGRCACIFWSMVIMMCINIWSASMTKSTDYEPFIVSRLFAGLVGAAPLTVGADLIVEMFFLHDRGKCFVLYTGSILLGLVASTTISGFVAQSASWTVQFWYQVALEGCLAILCPLVLDETGWTREETQVFPQAPHGFVARKLATYLFTQRLMPRTTGREMLQIIAVPFKIAICPVAVLTGTAMTIYFGFVIAVLTVEAVILQEPVASGGYGFSPSRNAAFNFSQWVGIAASVAYGHFVNDRLPLWLCSRRGGQWHPEYRLYPLILPILIFLPLGLGIFGACLYYHWHYMVLAFSLFLQIFAVLSGFAPVVNYVIEAIGRRWANEAMAAMTFWRIIFGISIPFFLFPWAAKVGMQWVFGMMAFFTIFAFGLIVTVMIWGEKLRRFNFVKDSNIEEGSRILNHGEDQGEKVDSA